VNEFGIAPKQDVHFMMTTGAIAQGQAALYVCEVATGKFGVYTMGAGDGGGIQIRRHDLTTFRAAKPGVEAAGATVPAGKPKTGGGSEGQVKPNAAGRRDPIAGPGGRLHF